MGNGRRKKGEEELGSTVGRIEGGEWDEGQHMKKEGSLSGKNKAGCCNLLASCN